jgi:hypothetical protein
MYYQNLHTGDEHESQARRSKDRVKTKNLIHTVTVVTRPDPCLRNQQGRDPQS